MYVCICHNITDQKLQEALKKSKGDVKDTLKKLGMGNSCGTCVVESIDRLLNQKSSKKTPSQVG